MTYMTSNFSRILADRDPFQFLEQQEGTVFRQLEGRCTKRIELSGEGYFVKIHRGVGWLEIIKNLVQFRLPVTSARNEFDATQRLQALGVNTLTVEAYGRQGRNPARTASFLVTRELTNTVSLEDHCAHWAESPPPVKLKRRLIRAIADISRTMHGNGICHRDFYLCHFHLHLDSLVATDGSLPKLTLIDLHRALVKNRLTQRWKEKDLAGLYFSSLHTGLTDRDRLRFVRTYSGVSLRSALGTQRRFWKRVVSKGRDLYRKENKGL